MRRVRPLSPLCPLVHMLVHRTAGALCGEPGERSVAGQLWRLKVGLCGRLSGTVSCVSCVRETARQGRPPASCGRFSIYLSVPVSVCS